MANVKKTQYKQKSADRTHNFVPFIERAGTSKSSTKSFNSTAPTKADHLYQFTNDYAKGSTHKKSYKYLKPRNIFNSAGNPAIPVTIKASDRAGAGNAPMLTPGTDSMKHLNKGVNNTNDRNLFIAKDDSVLATDSSGNNINLKKMVDDIHTAIMIPSSKEIGARTGFKNMARYYNRFKVPNLNLPLQKGFPHVFFVRPSCNILKTKDTLNPELANNHLFNYAMNHCPELLGELVMGKSHNTDNDFMMTLSNFVASFSLSDEYLQTESYGKTFTGYKITYGKHDIESKTAGTFDVTLDDDRYIHVYQLIRLWAEYISHVYRGNISPTHSTIWHKVLDYASAVYYFITGEDGETIIFWSKYYGVFPSTIPSSQYSWGAGNVITSPQLNVTFNYSFKKDYDPDIFLEFNYNARIESVGAKNIKTVPTYDDGLLHSSYKWSRTPFVQIVQGGNDMPFVYKLRHIGK